MSTVSDNNEKSDLTKDWYHIPVGADLMMHCAARATHIANEQKIDDVEGMSKVFGIDFGAVLNHSSVVVNTLSDEGHIPATDVDDHTSTYALGFIVGRMFEQCDDHADNDTEEEA